MVHVRNGLRPLLASVSRRGTCRTTKSARVVFRVHEREKRGLVLSYRGTQHQGSRSPRQALVPVDALDDGAERRGVSLSRLRAAALS